MIQRITIALHSILICIWIEENLLEQGFRVTPAWLAISALVAFGFAFITAMIFSVRGSRF